MNVRRKNRWLAFVFAPMMPSVILVFALNLTNPQLLAFALLFSIPFSYAPSLLIGLPLMEFLEKRGALSALNMTAWGALFGVVIFYLYGFAISSMLDSPKSAIPALGEVVSGALLGISVAVPFSLIAGFPVVSSRRRPDDGGLKKEEEN